MLKPDKHETYNQIRMVERALLRDIVLSTIAIGALIALVCAL